MLILNGRRIRLVEIRDIDLPFLLECRNERRFIDFCTMRKDTVSLEAFKVELKADFAKDRYLQCVIEAKSGPVGTIYAYGVNRAHGYGFVTTYLAPGQEKPGYAVEAFTIFSQYLFRSLNLYKLYFEVYAYNDRSLRCFRDNWFVEEGRFRGHAVHEGERYDLLRYALFRDSLGDLDAVVKKLTRH